MSKLTRIAFFTATLLLAGCITFHAVPPGESSFSGLTVSAQSTWNQAPRQWIRRMRPDAQAWTSNGLLLDRILFIPAIAPGETIFRELSSQDALPIFDSNMLPNEIEELVESSIAKLFGEGGAVVETSGLRPHRFGDDRGLMFDLSVSVSDGPDYRGVTGAFVSGERLNLIIFLAVIPHYYDEYRDEAVDIIKSARVSGEA